MRMLLWVAATVAGCAIAGAVGHFPGSFPVGSGTQSEIAPSALAFGFLIGTLFALPLGVLQWLVLRAVGIGPRWIAATAIGVGLMHAAGDGAPAPYAWAVLSKTDGWLAVSAVGGLLIAFMQVQAAHGLLAARTWVAVSVIAWPLGIVGGLWIMNSSDLEALSGPSAWAQEHALVAVVTGLVVGVVTGFLIPRSRPAAATAF